MRDARSRGCGGGGEVAGRAYLGLDTPVQSRTLAARALPHSGQQPHIRAVRRVHALDDDVSSPGQPYPFRTPEPPLRCCPSTCLYIARLGCAQAVSRVRSVPQAPFTPSTYPPDPPHSPTAKVEGPSDKREKSKQTSPPPGNPSIMAGSQRYMRYIVFAVFALVVLYFISSSSVSSASWPSYQDTTTAPSTPSKPQAGLTVDSPLPPTTPNEKVLPPATISGDRMNATFVTLARNSDVWEIAKSIRHVEDRFNRKFNYDWVFLNDDDFSDEFKRVTSALVSGKTKYGKIPTEHWSFPEWIDQDKAARVREEMKEKKIIYGDSVSYRHMCRYESGFFFRHPLMLDYEWYWRVEPSIELYCDINYDTFKFMAEKKKKYSFTLSLYEYVETIPTLWDATKNFTKHYPQHISKDNSMKFLSDDGGETYNKCHFWSNFEIGNLNWLRSDAYIDFFTSLDHAGGFFYERWGDAPVHSIAAGLMLNKDELHFFNDIAYYHVPFTHCPTGEDYRIEHKCSCNPKDNFDWNGYSCTSRFYELNGMTKPAGYEKEQ